MRQDIDHVAAGLAACLPALYRALDRQVGQDFPHPKPPEAQLALLSHVEAHEGVTVREAADALLMKPNNVSALVTQMTEQGMLERRQDPADKRVAHLHLTPTSRERLAEVNQLKGAHLARALRALTDGELDALGSALGALESLSGRLHTHAR
ncbi:MarR family winged helix-turn-helix transcriptional regulator [Streptomyces justiciae]|uniref:MarR family transcriptional regulator n=1 Tax=Streptomyces justiciae TaxID=2780140 RepID=A0ABU3LTE2_9ACTN|nr:MarR family transcriptional regulator [Streptomyces justiciae]MBE8473553.1 MarR family transcriptional regulator [Streptomyces justiciae]MCW8378196.1 MarR family transcriptional regulator [Streptomyces justiciae]MDT7841822.1 MarR family transcriptional regulator [Streptomyces justiciae]